MLKVPLSWFWGIAAFALLSFAALSFFHFRTEEVGGRYAPGTCLNEKETGVLSKVESLQDGVYTLRTIKSEKFAEQEPYEIGRVSHHPVAVLDASSDQRAAPCPSIQD